jgi:hypothetical protein
MAPGCDCHGNEHQYDGAIVSQPQAPFFAELNTEDHFQDELPDHFAARLSVRELCFQRPYGGGAFNKVRPAYVSFIDSPCVPLTFT